MGQNILTILGIASKEDVITNLLRYCIEVSPLFRQAFLENICDVQVSKVSKVIAHTRISTGSNGVPDLILALDGSDKKTLIVLENKLKADEGEDQTSRYSSFECMQEIKRQLDWAQVDVDVKFVFLTLHPDQEPVQVFRLVTYKELLETVRKLPPVEDPLAQLLLDAWEALLQDFYSNAAIAERDLLLAKLNQMDPLEGNYLYFKSFAQSISLQGGLEVEYPFRSSAQGRRYFGVVISKDTWHPMEMKRIDGAYQLDARKNCNIHFELQFHCLKGTLELYLHYEVNPYQPKAWMNKNVSHAEHDAFFNVRNEFIEALRLKAIAELVIGGGSNQIAKVQLQLFDATVVNARKKIAETVNHIAVHIDEILMAKAAS